MAIPTWSKVTALATVQLEARLTINQQKLRGSAIRDVLTNVCLIKALWELVSASVAAISSSFALDLPVFQADLLWICPVFQAVGPHHDALFEKQVSWAPRYNLPVLNV
jgi:hypothetical protein